MKTLMTFSIWSIAIGASLAIASPSVYGYVCECWVGDDGCGGCRPFAGASTECNSKTVNICDDGSVSDDCVWSPFQVPCVNCRVYTNTNCEGDGVSSPQSAPRADTILSDQCD